MPPIARGTPSPSAILARDGRSILDSGGDIDKVIRVAVRATHGMSRPQALALWRSILRRFPDEPRLAARYIDELMLVEAWEELDRFFPSARGHLSAEIDLRYVDAALLRLDAVSAESMLGDLHERDGESYPRLVRLYRLMMLQRRFQEAGEIARSMRRYTDDRSHTAALARTASRYRSIQRAAGRARSAERDYDILLINLDSDATRLQRMNRQLDGLQYTRIPGVRGAYLPEYARRSLTQGLAHAQKGTVGCFLSHVVAWEAVVRSQRTSLVLEDDAWLVVDLPPSVGRYRLPADFELCFVNERMKPASYEYGGRAYLAPTVADVVRDKSPNWSAAGTDGYFISPRGARKLLALIERDGIAGDVDWRLVSYALTASQRRAAIRRGGFAGAALGLHEQVRRRGARLHAYVLLPAIVRQFHGGSVRLWDNELSHAHMAVVHDVMARRRRGAPA